MKKEKPFWLKALLLLLFLGGLALNLLIVSDLAFFGWLRGWHAVEARPGGAKPPVGPANRESLTNSVALVVVAGCSGGAGNGTGFVVAPGYLITAEHVVADAIACRSQIVVVDKNLRRYDATVEGHSNFDDLALLKIDDSSLPAMTLAKSDSFLEMEELVSVFTLGYPLIGDASTPGKAAFSGVGSVSQFRKETNRFVTSNLNLNPGNSGGPVVLTSDNKVIGVALAVLSGEGRERAPDGIGYVVPSAAVERLFREKTGRSLP
jgi:S1-C subfamily serine protease